MRRPAETWHQKPDGSWAQCMTEEGRPCRIHNESEHLTAGSRKELEHRLEQINKNNASTQALSKRTPPSLVERAEYQKRILNDAIRNHTQISKLDRDYRKAFVEDVTNAAVKAHKDTRSSHTRILPEGVRVYDKERQALHLDIVEKVMKSAKNVKREGKVLFTGGLGGAGKTTVLKMAGYDPKSYLVINNDDIKEELARRGKIPRIKGLTPMEACPLVHEEASDITKMILMEAASRKINIIIDGTMGNAKKIQSKIDLLRSSGYKDIKAVFVDIDPDVSVGRAESRYQRGMDNYTALGRGNGGRWLPKSVIDKNRSDDPNFKSKNAKAVVELHRAGVFTEEPEIWNNNIDGVKPTRVSYSDFSGDSISMIMG